MTERDFGCALSGDQADQDRLAEEKLKEAGKKANAKADKKKAKAEAKAEKKRAKLMNFVSKPRNCVSKSHKNEEICI